MISVIFTRSGGPPAAALITSAAWRKYCGPMAAGVITQSVFVPAAVVVEPMNGVDSPGRHLIETAHRS